MWRVSRLMPESGFSRRGVALVLALAIEALVALLLFFLVPPLAGRKQPERTTTFSVDAAPAEKDASEPAKPERKKRTEREALRPPTPQPPKAVPPPVPETPRGPLPFIVMTRDEYRAARITNMRSRPAEPAAAGASSAEDSSLAAGKGPGGEPLYAAEWHVRPSKAQLATYISSRARESGWGLIACRTIANYRVEDCRELGESPRGSGLAGSVRQAAWQFRVRPPRIGGKDMVGEWVRSASITR
ncbi:hypothetical protein [Sphingomonas sp.]|jgi:protein TonB|uniref:hypothetical protein n=1 Tax=Sphingomonas sp. TaxID=28214 RepID=UPI002EDB2107